MRAPRHGISLIEITIVILLLGILAAVASPRFADSLQSGKLISAANQIAGHIDYVRRAAINEGKSTSFFCDGDTDTYGSHDVEFPQLPGQLLNVAVKTFHDRAFELSADFDGKAALSFDFEGTPTVGGAPLTSGKVTIACGDRAFDILVAAGTGETVIVRRDGNLPNQNSAAVHTPVNDDGAEASL
jgi:prepilin-type N-terminal cleavage/methylation domain-containing protein